MKKFQNTAKLLFITLILTACLSTADVVQTSTASPTSTFLSIPSTTEQIKNTPPPKTTATPSIESNMSKIQFKEYSFPEYDQSKVSHNGVTLNLSGIYAINNKTVFLFGNLGIVDGIGQHSLLLRSTDGGQDWQEVNIKQEYNFTIMMVAFINNGIGWALSAVDVEDSSAGNLYRSSDYGKTWSEPISIGGFGFHPWGIRFTDENNGYIKFYWDTLGFNDHFGILSTTDGGMTWKETFTQPFVYGKDVTKYEQGFEQARKELGEPIGGDYGSYWVKYWTKTTDLKTHDARGQDGSEWILHYDELSAVYIVLQRPDSKAPWSEVSTISNRYNYNNGKVANP